MPARATAKETTASTGSDGPFAASRVAPTTGARYLGMIPAVAEIPSTPAAAAPTASSAIGARIIAPGSCGSPWYRRSPKNTRKVARLSYSAVRKAPNNAAIHSPVRPPWLAAATT